MVTTDEPQPNPSDAEIESRLRAGPAELWKRLWASAEAFSQLKEPATWGGGPTDERDAAGQPILQFPYIDYAAPVNEIEDLFYELGIVVSFPWWQWYELELYPRGEGLDVAHVADAARLATCYMRGERFTTGAIEMGIEDGSLAAILRCLRSWWETWAATAPDPRAADD